MNIVDYIKLSLDKDNYDKIIIYLNENINIDVKVKEKVKYLKLSAVILKITGTFYKKRNIVLNMLNHN
ncbi:hypothetical protein [Halarcobacter sp.]|uniref:hypothetical protein n=1 Tax=Halarcobacter sp. TaxID=2321133 RepID=UPI002AA910E3|nr:hypothetical protein [Halarcobacter sp.]